MLSSIQVREVALEQEEIFSDVLVARPLSCQILRNVCFASHWNDQLAFGLSGMKFGQTLPLTRAALERDYDITYYKPADLLPKISSASDGPKDAAGETKGC